MIYLISRKGFMVNRALSSSTGKWRIPCFRQNARMGSVSGETNEISNPGPDIGKQGKKNLLSPAHFARVIVVAYLHFDDQFSVYYISVCHRGDNGSSYFTIRVSSGCKGRKGAVRRVHSCDFGRQRRNLMHRGDHRISGGTD